MLLAWKNAHRFDASTFLLIDSVCAPLPSVSDSARQSAIMAISSAIFLLDPEACSAFSACSILSCALMFPPSSRPVATIAERLRLGKCQADVTGACRRERSGHSAAGMRAAIDFKQPLRVDAGINLGRRERRVAEQFLNCAEVAAAAQEVGRKRMPQCVGRGGVRQAECAAQPLHGQLDDARAQGASAGADE